MIGYEMRQSQTLNIDKTIIEPIFERINIDKLIIILFLAGI